MTTKEDPNYEGHCIYDYDFECEGKKCNDCGKFDDDNEVFWEWGK